MRIGEKIIEEIAKGGMFSTRDADGEIDRPLIYVWSSGAAEQLEAVVEAYVQERIDASIKDYESQFDLPGGEA